MKRILLLTVWSSLFGIAGAFAQTEDAAALLAAGDARGAMIRYERAIQSAPDDANARLGLAKALVVLGEFDRAEKMARVALRRLNNADASLVLAEALMGLERFAEADDAARSAEGHADAGVVRALIAGEQAMLLGDPVGALRIVGPVANHPRLGTHARMIGARAQYARGDLVRARRLVDAILNEGGNTLPALQLRAQLALKSGDYDLASDLADQILARDTGNAAATVVVVEASLRRNDPATARAALAGIAPKDVGDPRPQYLEALILLSEGRTREAGDVAATIEPWLVTAPGGAVLLAQIKIDLDRLSQAESVLRDRVGVAPDDRAARRLLIEVFDRTDRGDRGDQLLADGLAAAPGDPLLLRLKADREMASGAFDAAASTLRQIGSGGQLALATALAAKSDASSPAQTSLSNDLLAVSAALRANRSDLALERAQRAVVASGRAPMAQNLLAAALVQSGQREEAIRVLDDLIAAHPDFLAAILNRADLDADPAALLRHLEKAVAAGAGSPLVMTQVAIERFVYGQIDGAQSAATMVASASADATQGKLLLPRLLAVSGKPEEAKRLIDVQLAAAQMSPNGTSDFVVSASAILSHLGAHGRASEALARVANKDAPSPVFLAAGDAFMSDGQIDEAIDVLTRGLDQYPTDAKVAMALARAMGARLLSTSLPRLAGEARFKGFDSGVLKSAALAGAGDIAGARAELSSGQLARSPQRLMARGAFASTDAAREALLKDVMAVLAARPQDVALAALASGLAADLGDREAGELALATGLAAAPNDPILLNNMANLRLGSDPAGALEVARRAQRAAPEMPAVLETLADAEAANGNKVEADRLRRRAQLLSLVP